MFTDGEPEPKRKTLAERAGEPRSIAAPPTSRPAVKGTSLVGAARNNSFSSSVSSNKRMPSVSSRSTSNGSFSSSVGPGSRPKSAYGSRPPTSMAFAQSTTTRPTSMVAPRPATAVENHSSDEDLPAQGKRQGMLPLPSLPSSFQSSQGYSTLQSRKLRAPKSMQSLKSLRSVNNMRDVSVSTALSMLRIDEEQPSPWKEHQAISSTIPPTSSSSSCHKPSISTGLRNLRIDSAESALVLFQAPGDSLVAPKTPSQIPVLSKPETHPATPATPSKNPKISPQKALYLTKDSNIPAFTAWDVRGRLEDMEAMYSELKDKFSGTNMERNGLEEAVALFKGRSKLYSPLFA
jgi:kinesin family protein C1